MAEGMQQTLSRILKYVERSLFSEILNSCFHLMFHCTDISTNAQQDHYERAWSDLKNKNGTSTGGSYCNPSYSGSRD
jgi:hypothetical protein